jgi:hypothetical protein
MILRRHVPLLNFFTAMPDAFKFRDGEDDLTEVETFAVPKEAK